MSSTDAIVALTTPVEPVADPGDASKFRGEATLDPPDGPLAGCPERLHGSQSGIEPPGKINEAAIPEPPQRPTVPVGKLKRVLAQVPDDHCLVPSQVYDFFIVDKDGRNKGYISASGELHWWPGRN